MKVRCGCGFGAGREKKKRKAELSSLRAESVRESARGVAALLALEKLSLGTWSG